MKRVSENPCLFVALRLTFGTGKGVAKRMRDLFTDHVEKTSEIMYNDISRKIQDDLKSFRRKLLPCSSTRP